jgi:hypothetical protein
MARGSETVTIKPSTGRNSDGDPLPSGPERVVTGCVIAPRFSDEDAAGGQRIIEGLMLYLPPGNAAPSAEDRVNARGLDYEVDGVPGEFVNKSGVDKGVMVYLKREGA